MNINEVVARGLTTRDGVTMPTGIASTDLARLIAGLGGSSQPLTAPEGVVADRLRRLSVREDASPRFPGSLFANAGQQAGSHARARGMVTQRLMAEHCAHLTQQPRTSRVTVLRYRRPSRSTRLLMPGEAA